MSSLDFDQDTRLLLRSEGGYCNDPGDPGGPTNYGITIFDVRKYVKANATAQDVKDLTLAQAMTIYRERYWNAMRCDNLPAGLDYPIYDYGVNSGVGRPYRVAQTLLGLPVTGRPDAATLAALAKVDVDKFIDAIQDERLHFMKSLKGGAMWQRFGGGWGKRVESVRAVAHKQARGDHGGAFQEANKTPPASADASPKASHIDPKSKTAVIKSTAGGSVVVLAPAAGGGYGLLIAGLAIGTVIVIGGVAYYVISRNQQKKQDAVILPPGLAAGAFAKALRFGAQ